MQYLDQACELLGIDKYEDVPVLKNVCEKVNVPVKYLLLALFGLVLLFALSPMGQSFIQTIFCFFIPAFKSYKALQTTDDDRDDKIWLTYWIVFAFFHAFDSTLNTVLFFIPYFGLLRFAFLIAIYTSQTFGCLKIFDFVIEPAFGNLSKVIDGPIEAFEATMGLKEE